MVGDGVSVTLFDGHASHIDVLLMGNDYVTRFVIRSRKPLLGRLWWLRGRWLFLLLFKIIIHQRRVIWGVGSSHTQTLPAAPPTRKRREPPRPADPWSRENPVRW